MTPEGDAGGAPSWWERILFLEIRRPSGHQRPAETLSRVSRLSYALIAGGLWGVAAAVVAPLEMALVIALFGVCTIYLGSGLIVEGGGALMSTIHLPSGSTRSPDRGYSRAETMAARGIYEEAVHIYETAAQERPDDPEPCLRLARLHRDETGRHEESARWFRRARRRQGASEDLDRQICRELIELYRRHMEKPRRAIPELARLAARHPDGPDGEWARREHRRLKEELVGPPED